MKHVRILKHTHGLNPSEEAGFEDAVADALVASGHAEIFDFKLPKQSKKEIEQIAAAAAEQKAADDKLAAEQAAAELAATEAEKAAKGK